MNLSNEVKITEQRYQELLEQEIYLQCILENNPELASGANKKLTPAAKKYKAILSSFVKRVDEVLSSPELVGLFTFAAVHGIQYKGPSLAQDIADVKAALGDKA